MSSNLHRNSTEANKHTPKGFDLADNNSTLLRDERGQSRYIDNLVNERVENLVDGNSAPPTTTSGHLYVLIDEGSGTVNTDWNGANYDDIVRIQDGVWVSITPVNGYLVFNKTDEKYYKFGSTGWVEFGGSVVWGNITGTLSDQTDLQAELDAKQDTLVSGTTIKTLNSESLLGSGNIVLNPNAYYDDVNPTPLTARGKLRALEYIEMVDNPTTQETEIQLRADSLLNAETTRFGENGSGNVDLKIQEKKLPTGDVNGFAIEYTASSECLLGLDSDSKIKEFEAVEIYNILKEEGVTGDKQLALLDINGNSANVKAKFEISAIVVQNTTANAVTINIGSTALGTDVVNAFVLGASETKKLPLSTTFFSTTTGQNLFISSALWNSANINIHVTISKIWQ